MFCCLCKDTFYDYVVENNNSLGYCEKHHKQKLVLLGYCRTMGIINKNLQYIDPKEHE